MQVYGNGHCINVEIEYRSPFVKVWSDKNDKVYYVSCPYEQRLQVANTVGDVIEEHGKEKDFWAILGDILHSQFGLINFDSPRKRMKTSKPKEHIPKINMLATYAKVLYKGDTVNVIFSNDQETNTITFKRRKSWSHKKYVDKALSESGITPSWNFRYGWEVSA